MYVCICNAVTEKTIRAAVADGVYSLSELSRRTGCAASCGSCAELAEQVLHEALHRRPFCVPLVAAA